MDEGTVVDEPRLRLSLDGTAVPAAPVGAGQYTLQLARALASRSDVDLLAFVRSSDADRWRGVAPAAEVVAVAPDARPLRLVWEPGASPGSSPDDGSWSITDRTTPCPSGRRSPLR